jgi:D-alanyl-D-alanine carboxypeptidase/D-alanyl-D-alanine-endopeptidase (penicillin-binding protein 4)
LKYEKDLSIFDNMLELLSSGLMSVWLEVAGVHPRRPDALQLFVGQGIPGFVWPGMEDPIANATLEDYLAELAARGFLPESHGIWLQTTQGELLGNHQGNIPRSAASITKVATSLAALSTWGPDHQFETLIAARGSVVDGVLQGDLVIVGGDDPLFVWEEAIALGNALNQVGIRQVTGNLVITGNFLMNYQSDGQKSGELLKQALNSELWSEDITTIYQKMRSGGDRAEDATTNPIALKTLLRTKPQVAIAGQVILSQEPISNTTLLIRHDSLPLTELLKRMNIYSNNAMAEMMATALGGSQVVQKIAAREAGVPPEQIQLINGSGLGQENRISPRAACGLFMAIQALLYHVQPKSMNLADLFPISGTDGGTLEDRNVPAGSVVKTGTLWNVSALGGVLPTRDRGLVWFAILNGGGDDIWGFRDRQDKLLQQLSNQWGKPSSVPPEITRHPPSNPELTRLGAPDRNTLLIGNSSAGLGEAFAHEF